MQSYMLTHHIPQRNRIMTFAQSAAYRLPPSRHIIDGFRLDTLAYDPAGTFPNVGPFSGSFLYSNTCTKHPSSSDIYMGNSAGQFCKWQAANPGEWSRIKDMSDGGEPAAVVTWMGAGLRDAVQAYLVTGAPTFPLVEYRPVNRCRTPIAPPVIVSVQPGETDVTVTLAEPPG